MSNQLPSFDFSGMQLKSDVDLKDALKGSNGDDSKFFRPGKHEVTPASSIPIQRGARFASSLKASTAKPLAQR